jgi:hypothetical protein
VIVRGAWQYVLCGVGSVVHQQQLDVLDVADEEGLVARRSHVAGLLVGTEADLDRSKSSQSSTPLAFRAVCRPFSRSERTEGMTWVPLNRLRTRLSIPLGLRHFDDRHLKRSAWCLLNVLVPVHNAHQFSIPTYSIGQHRRSVRGTPIEG